MIKLEERRASIQPIKSKLKISILDDQEISQINQNARAVLEEVGVKFPSEKALKILAEVGANVDFDSQLVKIPADYLINTLPHHHVPTQWQGFAQILMFMLAVMKAHISTAAVKLPK